MRARVVRPVLMSPVWRVRDHVISVLVSSRGLSGGCGVHMSVVAVMCMIHIVPVVQWSVAVF